MTLRLQMKIAVLAFYFSLLRRSSDNKRMRWITHPARCQWRAWLLAALVVLLMGVQTRGQDKPPEQAIEGVDLGRDRIVHKFDFEEAGIGNFEDMPRYWYVMGKADQTSDPNFNEKPLHRQMVAREGFPRFTKVRFSQPQTEKGDHSLYLGLNSGSAGAFLEVGAVAAVPQSDYVVTARIKTSMLEYSRARLIAYFVDAQGRRIDASAVATPLMRTKDKWQQVTVKLLGDHPEAAWIGMQVELLQVQHQTPLRAAQNQTLATPGKHTVLYQDNKGEAWFDDVTIWQVPRVVVRTQSAANLIVAPQQPLLTFEVRDLSGRKLSASVAIYDHEGRKIAQVDRTVGGGEASTWRWTPPLPALGWYLVDLTLRDAQVASISAEPVARTLRAFLWLPARAVTDSQDKRLFSLDVQDVSLDELHLLPQVTQATGLASVILSAWDRDVSIATQETRMAELDSIFQPLWRQGASVSMSLSPLPRELSDRLDLDPDSPVWLFAKPSKEWMPWVGPLVIRHGQNVRRWFMGQDVGGEFGSPLIDPVTARAVSSIIDLTPDPSVVLPWELSTPRRASLRHRELAFNIDVPATVQPAKLGEFLSEWQKSPKHNITLTTRIHPATVMTQRRRVDDLAMRVLHGWEQNVNGITLPRPWDFGHDRFNALHPDPLLSAFATLAHQLDGRRVITRLPLGTGASAMILNGERGPMLAAWLDGGPSDKREVRVYLGEHPVATDIWGNKKTIDLKGDRHQFTITSTPIFIEGIDAELAIFRASFAVTPNLIESSQITHEHEITLHNPWPQALQGELTILEPGRDWKIDPRRVQVAIEPNQTVKIPVRIAFPVAEVAGEKKVMARFDFMTGKRNPIDLETTMTLGLAGIEMDTGLSVGTNDKTNQWDATAMAFVSNTGEQSRTLYIFAICANQPRQERIITLKPGQSLMRRFRFANINEETMQSPVRIGLRDTTGPSLMNHVLPFEDE